MASGRKQGLLAACEVERPTVFQQGKGATECVPILGAEAKLSQKELPIVEGFTIKVGNASTGSPGRITSLAGKPSVASRISVGSPQGAVSEMSANLARARAYEAAQRDILKTVDQMKAQAASKIPTAAPNSDSA